jgi:hypothetical protein
MYPNSTPIEISKQTGIHPALIGIALYELELKEAIAHENRSKKRGSIKYFVKSEGRFS